ncbi:MAG: hypothetical protein ACXWQZ_01365, partial [Ktedonobacterales bacterium]
MADDAVSWQDYKSPDERAAEQADASKKDNASPTWADYGKTLAIGGADVAQGVGSMLQASGDANQLPGEKPDTFTNALGAMGKWLREKTGEYSDETVESLSPAAKKRLESTLTSSEFWDHPVSALMLKSTRQVPQLATALVPAGLAVKAAQAGVIAAGMNGVLNAAQSVQGFYDIVDKASDQELRQSKFYNDLRDAGMSEDTARTRFRQKLSGNEPLVNFVIGSITGAVSPEAMLARSITGGTGVIGAAGRGIAGRAGLGLAEGAVGGGIEEGVQNYGTQIQQMQQNLKQSFDTGSLVDAVLEGGAIEGLMGGVAGASSRSHAAKTTDHTTASPKVPSTADTTATDNPAQVNQNPKGITTGVQPQPPGTRTGGEDYSKAQNGKKGKKSVTVTDKSQVEAPPNAATLEQAAAMQGESSPTVPRAEDIMANVVQSTRAQAAGQPTVPVQEQTAAPGAVAPPQVPAQVQPIQEAPPQPSGALPVDGGPSDIPVQPSAVAPGVEPNAPVAPQGVSPDVAEATSGATAPVTPRVLPDQTAASRQNAAAQLRVQDQNLKAAQAEPTAPKGSNYTLKEQAANKFRDEVHKTVVERNAPVKGETDEQTFARAKRMVEEATPELAKIANPEHKPTAKMLRASKLPTRLKGENHTGPTAVLAEAAALHKASTRGPKLKAEALTRFRANEAAARAGNVAEVLSSRRVEGEVNRAPEQTSAPVGGAVEAEDKLTASPEEEVISREEEDLTEGGKLAGEKRVDQAEERAKAAAEKVVQKVLAKKEIPLQVIPKEPSYQAVTSRVTPVKVEVKRSKRTFPKAEAAKAVSIARAAAKTEVGLTEAQKKSGNYVKGVADVSGVKVAIETARGEERTGKDQNGVEWRVKMPDHYGEIQGTRGADGDKVDAYIGTDPTSKHVFVIDQQDPDTGAFDEHKAMLHYADAQKALDAYEKAFSDGRGLERVASMRSMTLDEFKAWKNNRKATTAPTDAHPEVAEAPARVTLPEGKAIPTNLPTTKVDVFLGGEKTGQHEVNALKVAPLRSFLNSELIEPLNGPLKPYFNLIRRRILAATPNTKVVVLHPNEIGRIKGEQAAYGAAGYYDYVNDQVILNANELTRGSQELTHTLLHEAIHAATYGQMVSYRGPARFVREVMNEVAFLHPDATTEYGFTNEDEFLAEALTDAKFQNFLVNTPLSEGLAKKLDIKSWRGESVWGAIVQSIRKLLGLPAHVTTALDAALSITDRLASTPVHEDIRAGWDELKQRRFEEAPARLVDSVTQAAHELVTRAPKQEQMGKPWALKVMMTDQIAQMAENYFPNNNPVRRVADLMERTRTLAKRYLEGNGAILQRQAELQKKYNGPVWDQFVSMVHDETTAKVWADVPLTDAKNAHLGKDRLDTAWARAQHAELRKEYLALTATRPDLAKLRKDSIAFYRDTQNKMALKLIENRVLKALGIKDPALAQRVFDETTTASDEALLGKDVIEMIQKTSELAKIKGPYFPL